MDYKFNVQIILISYCNIYFSLFFRKKIKNLKVQVLFLFRYEVLKVKERLNVDNYCCIVQRFLRYHQTHDAIFILISCTIPFILIFIMHFSNVRSMFLLLFNQSQSTTSVVNQMIHPYFHKRSTAGQLNVEASTPEREK